MALSEVDGRNRGAKSHKAVSLTEPKVRLVGQVCAWENLLFGKEFHLTLPWLTLKPHEWQDFV